MPILSQPILKCTGSLLTLLLVSCTATMQATHRDPLTNRTIQVRGLTASVESDPGRPETVNVQVGNRRLVVERTRLVVDERITVPLDPEARVIEIDRKNGSLSVSADGIVVLSENRDAS